MSKKEIKDEVIIPYVSIVYDTLVSNKNECYIVVGEQALLDEEGHIVLFEDEHMAQMYLNEELGLNDSRYFESEENNYLRIVKSSIPNVPEQLKLDYSLENNSITLYIKLMVPLFTRGEQPDYDAIAIEAMEKWATNIAEGIPELKEDIMETLNMDWYSGMKFGGRRYHYYAFFIYF